MWALPLYCRPGAVGAPQAGMAAGPAVAEVGPAAATTEAGDGGSGAGATSGVGGGGGGASAFVEPSAIHVQDRQGDAPAGNGQVIIFW